MLPLVRREKIIDMVKSRGSLTIEELCQSLGVSSSSVRRDLAKLEAGNELRRTHGGAVAVKEEMRPPLSFDEKKEMNIAAKKRIAHKAASLIRTGETICLDGGTTTHLIAEEAARLSSLTVVTNSISILNYLCRFPHIKLIAIGGMVKHDIQGIVGHLTNDILEKIRINKLFLGADGVFPGKGIFTSSEMEAFTKAKMMGCSQEVILVADSLKIGQTALVKFSSLKDMDLVITDRGCPKKFLREFHKMKIKLEVV